MNARPGWTPQKQEYQDLASEAEDERATAESEMCEVEFTLALLRQHAARGHWQPGEVERLCADAAERMQSIAELMDQEARH